MRSLHKRLGFYKPRNNPGKNFGEYFGNAEGCYLCLQERECNFSIARVFGSCTAFWRYTYDGRIYNIAYTVKEDDKKRCGVLVDVITVNSLRAWGEGFASVFPIPETLARIDGEIIQHHPEDQYRIIISRGIKNVLRLLTSLDKPEIEVPRRPGQQTLHELRENAPVCHALEFIAHQEPSIELIDATQLRILYK